MPADPAADLQAVVERLEGCPFCGSGPASINPVTATRFSGVELMDRFNAPYVWCGTCCAQTRTCDSVAEAMEAWNTRSPTLLAALRQPVEGALDREQVARIIDPGEFRRWQSMYDYCIKVGDSKEEARASADWAHKQGCDVALAKADAILALANVRDTGRGGG